jgi:hypothetical protein
MLELYKNGEGYFDPTMGDALAYEERRRKKAKYVISVILFIAREAGFHIDSQIELTDYATGRKII